MGKHESVGEAEGELLKKPRSFEAGQLRSSQIPSFFTSSL